MIGYLRAGDIPSKRHIAHYVGGQLLNEYCFTREGFDQPFSTLYLFNPPTGETSAEIYSEACGSKPAKRDNLPLRRRHFKSGLLLPSGDFITGRKILTFNEDLNYGLCHPLKSGEAFFANNDADELFFLFKGAMEMQSLFGKLSLTAGDYLIVPRSCPYRFNFASPPQLLFVEARNGLQVPPAFLNGAGQFKMDAPYSERSFKTPEWDGPLFEKESPTAIVRKRQGSFTKTLYKNNYFRMSGWDGNVYPCALNLKDILPKTGRTHLPPSSHLTFIGKGFAVMSFLPRLLDYDKEAVPCPFYHSSVNCDELLFYVSGQFTSRKTVGQGSISFHPSGIPHGPHPGAYKGSIGLKETREEAVMVDTFAPLTLTEESAVLEDPDYPNSWKEEVP
ncbi:MAG: homogentisate 1,2-dioxygenase [Nitrospinae bacterium]|nr:homogentisate 1,2-dioxygenase [Nitrospinota bacterium]